MGGGGEAAAVSAPAEEAAGKDGEEGSRWTLKEKLMLVWVLVAATFGVYLHWNSRHAALRKAEEGLVSMCEERARMLQDQFAVSVNHVHALAILVATFHYEKHPPALDQVRAPPPNRASLSSGLLPTSAACFLLVLVGAISGFLFCARS